jgi:hypothetical protein
VVYLGADEFLQASTNVIAGFGSHQQVEIFDSRTTPQQFLYQHFAHESRGTGDEDGTVPVEPDYIRVDHFGGCDLVWTVVD